VLHTGGAGAMVVVLTWLLMSTRSRVNQIAALNPAAGPTP
jgi:hypothetical protein